MKNSLARGAVVAFVSAASILPVAGGAQAAVAHDTPSAVSAWTHDQDHGFRCGRFGRDGGRWDGDGRGDGDGRWNGDWWGGRDWYDRYCGPWGINKWTKFSRLDYSSIRNSAIVILR